MAAALLALMSIVGAEKGYLQLHSPDWRRGRSA
jgi:hypothetical protein